MEGRTLPSFSVILDNSKLQFDTRSFRTGKPIILIYFTPSCPYCRVLTRRIINNMGKLKDIEFGFFTTSPYNEMKQYSDLYELNKFPNVKVGIDTSAFLQKYFQAQVVPFVAIYGKDRKLHRSYIGAASIDQIRKAADGLKL